MVAPVTALAPKAVRPLKVALPETAAFVAVPPSVMSGSDLSDDVGRSGDYRITVQVHNRYHRLICQDTTIGSPEI